MAQHLSIAYTYSFVIFIILADNKKYLTQCKYHLIAVILCCLRNTD